MRLAAFLPLAAAGLVASAASAQAPAAATADLRALAGQLAVLEKTADSARINAAENFDSSFIAGVRQQQGDAFLTDHAELVETMRRAGHAAFAKAFETNGLPALRDAMIDFDATHFTAAELTELIAFYSTPAAQKIVELQLLRSVRPGGPNAEDDAALKIAMADPGAIAFLATPTAKKESLLLSDAIAAGEQATAQANADNMPAIMQAIEDAAKAYAGQHPDGAAPAKPT